MRRTTHLVATAAFAVILAGALTACGPTTASPGANPSSTSSTAATAESTPTRSPSTGASASPTRTPSPTPTPTSVPVPDDCRAILSDEVLAELGSIPLNDPVAGPGGVQDDGSLICRWRDARADTTGLVTTISEMSRGPALDMLNQLVTTDGYSCFTPDKGTRCEKEWADDRYPVTNGRTLFWRDDLLIDTVYSNLAPTGYTSSIIDRVFD